MIKIDRNVCIGCQSCRRACPYDAILFNEEMRVSDKCDVCSELREIGEEPVCVKNCSGRALMFGDINDPDSEVSRAIREAGPENVYALKDFGNGPSGRFILKNARWLDILPQDYVRGMENVRSAEDVRNAEDIRNPEDVRNTEDIRSAEDIRDLKGKEAENNG